MALSCYHASLACAGALVAVELAAALGLRPAAALAAARLLLVCVWLRCWSGAPDGASGFPSAKGGAWTPCASAAAERALVRSAADAPGRPRTWRSAGVPLPRPELVMNLIKSRRSVFCKGMQPGRRVDAATLRLLLEAAAWAPSHGRSDPAHFVVFQSPQSLAELAAVSVEVLQREEGPQAAAAAREEFAPGKRWANAACLIAVCLRRRPRCCRRPGAAPQYNLEWEEVAAVGCAVQNLHLAATCLPGGLCGYWSSWYCCVRDSPELARLLGLAGDDRCLGFFVLGFCPHTESMRASRGPPSVEWR